MEKKICSKCKEEKEVCEFNKKPANKKGVRYYKSRCKNVKVWMKKSNEIKILKNIKYGMTKVVKKETNGGQNIIKKIKKKLEKKIKYTIKIEI